MSWTRTVVVVLALASSASAVLAAPAVEPPARPKRTRVAVMEFDYGAISDHWWGEHDIGKGIAVQVIDGLVNDGSVVVVERQQLGTVLAEQDLAHSERASPDAAALSRLGRLKGVRYIVTGSITRFGSEQRNFGAGKAGAALGPIGMFGFKKAKTQVAVTARLIDTSTGEIVLSAKGEGVSKKGGGVQVGGFAKVAGGASLNTSSDDYRSSAIGEAQELACQQLVQALLAKMTALEPAS